MLFRQQCKGRCYNITEGKQVMIDVATHQPMKVYSDGDAGPYIPVPVEQVSDVTDLLDRHRVEYWVDQGAVAIDDAPAITVINLGRTANAKRIQSLLDDVD